MSFLTGPFLGSPRRRCGVLLLALCLGVLVGCGADARAVTSAGSAPEATRVDVTETEFSITMPDSLAAGSYEFAVRNVGGAVHDLVVSQNGQDLAGSGSIAAGGSGSVTTTLQPVAVANQGLNSRSRPSLDG